MWAYNKQAQLLFDDKNHKDCIELYEKAMAIHSNHFGCQLNYAYTLSKLAQDNQDLPLFDKSLDNYEKLISGNSLQPIVLGQYSLTLHKKALLINDLELLKQSFDHFETALSFDSNNLDNLSISYLQEI